MKSQEDIAKLRHSSRILASCHFHLAKLVKPGVSAEELNGFAIKFIRSYNAEPSFLHYNGFAYALCTSINHEVVHGLSNREKVLPRDGLVSLDLGVNYQGLFSDSARTYILGEVSSKARMLVEQTHNALWAGIKAVKAGAKVGDIGFEVNRVAENHGLGNVIDLGGHGVGYGVHDDPFIVHKGKQGKGPTLFENQVIAIEPMFTLGSGHVDFDHSRGDGWTVRSSDGTLAAHWEHTVLVTKKGREVLTDIPEEEILPITF